MQHPVCTPPLPSSPFTFAILVDSPIRRNVSLCPVGAIIFPLAKADIPLASAIVAGLDVLMTFLFKRSLVQPPNPYRLSPANPITLTLPQLSEMMGAALNGTLPIQGPWTPNSAPGQGLGPAGGDEPLFPDNLSVSLSVAAPFAPFDGSPDTSFNVPLFEIPGVPGNLLLIIGLLIAQFFLERSDIGPNNQA